MIKINITFFKILLIYYYLFIAIIYVIFFKNS